MKLLINSAPRFVDEGTSFTDLLKVSDGGNVDCMLAVNSSQVVSGIVTRTDLIKGLMLFGPHSDTVQVSQIMSSNVEFARYQHLNLDVFRLFSEMHYHHFPVLRCQGSRMIQNIVGIISVSDIARQLLKTACMKAKEPS